MAKRGPKTKKPDNLIELVEDYLIQCETLEEVPDISGLKLFIKKKHPVDWKTSSSTIYKWKKSDQKLVETLEDLTLLQKHMLIQKGLKGSGIQI